VLSAIAELSCIYDALSVPCPINLQHSSRYGLVTVIVSFRNKYCELLCHNSMLILPCYMSQNRKRFVYYRASAFIHECNVWYFRRSVLSLSMTLRGHSLRGPSIQNFHDFRPTSRCISETVWDRIERKFQWLTIPYRTNNLVIDDLGWHQGHLDYFKARAVNCWNVQIYCICRVANYSWTISSNARRISYNVSLHSKLM